MLKQVININDLPYQHWWDTSLSRLGEQVPIRVNHSSLEAPIKLEILEVLGIDEAGKITYCNIAWLLVGIITKGGPLGH